MDYQEIVDKIKKAAIKRFEASDKANSRAANRQYDIIWRILKNIQGDSELCRKILLELVESEESSVRVTAAAVMLRLGIDTEKAEKVLEDENEKGGSSGADAYITLYFWRDSKKSEL